MTSPKYGYKTKTEGMSLRGNLPATFRCYVFSKDTIPKRSDLGVLLQNIYERLDIVITAFAGSCVLCGSFILLRSKAVLFFT